MEQLNDIDLLLQGMLGPDFDQTVSELDTDSLAALIADIYKDGNELSAESIPLPSTYDMSTPGVTTMRTPEIDDVPQLYNWIPDEAMTMRTPEVDADLDDETEAMTMRTPEVDADLDDETEEMTMRTPEAADAPQSRTIVTVGAFSFGPGDAVMIKVYTDEPNELNSEQPALVSDVKTDRKTGDKLIVVEWLYGRNESVIEYPQPLVKSNECFSNQELFRSNHVQTVHVNTINGPCRVQSIQGFLRSKPFNRQFFTRTSIRTRRENSAVICRIGKISCIGCRKIVNPDKASDENAMVLCTKCNRLSHLTCIQRRQTLRPAPTFKSKCSSFCCDSEKYHLNL